LQAKYQSKRDGKVWNSNMFNQGLNGREKIKFRVNLPKNRRIKGLKTKTE
jgi:hypothetical protein